MRAQPPRREQRQRELDRLLGQGALSGPEKDRILETVLERCVPERPSARFGLLGRRLSWIAAVALIVLAAPGLWYALRQDSGFRPKGSPVAGPLLEVGCEGACARGGVLFFRVEHSKEAAHLAAFATSAGGERIWYFPAADGSLPELPATDAPVVLPQGVRLGPEHAPGSYELHLLVLRRPASRERIDALIKGGSEDLLAHRTQTIEVR